MTIPPSFVNIGWKTYIIYAVLNASFILIIYFFLVETKGRSLEELDAIFAAPGDPVKNEKRVPHDISIAEGRRILGLDDDEVEVQSESSEKEGGKGQELNYA